MNWKRNNEKIAIISVTASWLIKFYDEVCAAADMRLRPYQFLWRVFRCDHRSAKIPAALDIQTHFEAKPVCFAQCVFEQLTPFGGEKSWAVRCAFVAVLTGAVGVGNDCSAKPF